MTMIISQLGLNTDTLQGETVIVTGAGGGIGYEAARALFGWAQTWSLPRSITKTDERPSTHWRRIRQRPRTVRPDRCR